MDDIQVYEFEKIASTCKKLGIAHIDILGGEPTLHPDLLELVDILDTHGLITRISTNGSNVPILNTLSEKYHKKSVSIGISINSDTLSKDLHNYILTFHPIIKSVVSDRLFIPKPCREFIQNPGIEYFLLYRDMVEDKDLNDIIPFHMFHNQLLRLKKRHKGIDGVFCSGFIPDTRNYPILESVRCPAGTTKLSLLPNGAVYPCYLFFRYEEFELGNIFTHDFKSIWENPILDFFRRFQKNTCPKTSCALFNACHGGCPAMSYAFFKGLDSPDPRCINPNVI